MSSKGPIPEEKGEKRVGHWGGGRGRMGERGKKEKQGGRSGKQRKRVCSVSQIAMATGLAQVKVTQAN